MTFTSLVESYIERWYTMSVDEYGFLFTENFSRNKYYLGDFVIELKAIFGHFQDPHEGTIFTIFFKWFEKQVVTYEGEEYLAENLCKSWVPAYERIYSNMGYTKK